MKLIAVLYKTAYIVYISYSPCHLSLHHSGDISCKKLIPLWRVNTTHCCHHMKEQFELLN